MAMAVAGPPLAVSAGDDKDTPLTAAEAASHIGEARCVCGVVAIATFAAKTKGQSTFLNLDKPYPAQMFTVVIWGD